MKTIPIAIDFDGTIVKHEFPEIGEEVPHAVRVIRRLMDNPIVTAILYTMRHDQENNRAVLREAEEWCITNGIPFEHSNLNPDQHRWSASKKVYAAVYIDDAALGCPLVIPDDGSRPYVDWLKVEELLTQKGLLK